MQGSSASILAAPSRRVDTAGLDKHGVQASEGGTKTTTSGVEGGAPAKPTRHTPMIGNEGG